jgi:hypothetical protein
MRRIAKCSFTWRGLSGTRRSKALLLAGSLVASLTLLGVPVTASTNGGRLASSDSVHATTAASFGSPLWIDQVGTATGFTSPTFATIDGVRAVVAASLNGEVYVVNAITGDALPGWPQKAIISGSTATAIESSPTVAYLDGPSGAPTIIVGAGSQSVPYQNGGVIAFYATGKVRFVFHTKDTFAQWKNSTNDNSVFATPAVGDILGNGVQDIVFGAYDHYIYALTPSGSLVPGFPIQRADTIWSSPVLVDSSHTGRDDIIMGGDSTGFKSTTGVPCYGGWVTDYRYESSTNTPWLMWERCVGQTVWSSPAVGVINPGSGNPTNKPAVVVGTSFNSPYFTNPATNEIFAFYAQNGDIVPGWPVKASGPTFGSPVIAQMTFGGAPVVISTSCAHCLHGPAVVSEWNGSGRRLWTEDISSKYQILSSPAVVNVDGTGPNDVLVGANPGVMVLNGSTGAAIYGTSQTPLGAYCSVNDAPATSPVRGSGAPASGWEVAFSCTKGGAAYLYTYALPATPDSVEWPQWRADATHTGIPDPWGDDKVACSVPATANGYQLVRADGNEYVTGKLPNCGGLHSEVIATPAVGQASTSDGGGYWIALSDGRVYAYGDAHSYGDGSTNDWTGGSVPPGAPVVGIAASTGSDTGGYYLLDGQGNVYAFGAPYYGEPSALDGTAVAIVADPDGGGYWVVTSNGHTYGFGTAANFAQPGGAAGIVGAASDPTGNGLWLASSSGTVYLAGNATSQGTAPAPATPIVGIAAAPGGAGYYTVTQAGHVYGFPSSLTPPSTPTLPEPVVGISAPAS